jgi:myo-inositol-1(or 4)-monophosphatase
MATLNHQWIPDLHHIQECLISLAKTAGSMILSANPTSSDTLTKKSSVDLVTATDAAVETMIFTTLRSNYPMCDLMGEESYRQGTKLTNAPTFIVDPIDGTTNFVHGNAYVAVSLGFTLNRTPMVGVVFGPFTQHLYTAIEGEGSFLTDYTFEAEIPKIRTRRLPLRQPLVPLCGLRGALVALEWGNEREGPNWECQVNTAKRLGASEKQGGAMVHSVRNLGSAALNICAVAEGSIDVYWEGGIWAWDVCAGWVVLKEAGGVIVDGNPGRWGNEIMVDHRKYLAVRAVGNGDGGRSQQQIVEEFWSFVEGTMVYEH